MPQPRLALAAVVVALLVVVPTVQAATYYVDPQNGSDSAAGTSASAPWETVPGTRTSNNSGFLRTQWGSVTQSNKVRCGDTLLLKGGSTHSTSTVPNGGAWRIGPTYYTSGCTAAAPIIIRIATTSEWSGSAGHFSISGSGVTNTSGKQGNGPCPPGGYCGVVDIEDLSYVSLLGLSNTQRIRIPAVSVTGPGQAGILLWGNGTTTSVGLEVGWVEISGKTQLDVGAAIDMGRIGHSVIHDVYIHDWNGPGIDTGLSAIHTVSGVGIVNAVVENSGPPVGSGGRNFTMDAFSFAAAAFDGNHGGGGGLWCINCTAKNHYWNGSNSGGCNSRFVDSQVRYRNLVIYGSGRTADPASARVALESSGDTAGCGGSGNALPEPTIWVSYSTLYNNFMSGQGRPHGTGSSFMWNTTMFRAGNTNASIVYDKTEGAGLIYNSLIASGTRELNAYLAGNSGDPAQNFFIPFSQTTLYHGNAMGSVVSRFNTQCSGLPSRVCRFQSDCAGLGACVIADQVYRTYSAPPGFLVGGGNLMGGGATNNPLFVNVSTSNCDVPFDTAIATNAYARCDFRLQSSSAAIDKATTYFLLANGSGSNGTTISVRGSGPNGGPSDPPLYQFGPGRLNWPGADHPHRTDPRMYFVAPGSFHRAAQVHGADTIQIKGATCQNAAQQLGSPERAVIVSMTATSITVDRACSWPNNAGIHLPWTGSAPDMGAYEYGLTGAPGGPEAPLLVSVEPLVP